MKAIIYSRFFQYLQNELAVPTASIDQALKSVGKDPHLLPIALWQCNMLTLKQLEQACDWLAIAYKKQDSIRASGR